MAAIRDQPVVQKVPTWFLEMEFCHIADGNGVQFCDRNTYTTITCKDYEGEAICPTCGNPTCPRCAQLYDLSLRLES